MAEVSMARLRAMLQTCEPCERICPDIDPHTLPCWPWEEEWKGMAAELIKLRELVGAPRNFRADLKSDCVILEVPYDEFLRCRRLSGAMI